MPEHDAERRDARARYARDLARGSGVGDPRIERAFATVRREDFLGPPPWRVFEAGSFSEIATSDPDDVYRNALVVLDAAKGLNNGEPLLHAMWIARAAPRSGETIVHVGAGAGYYTAILAELTGPRGAVHAFEIDAGLAEMARKNLAGRANVTVVTGDAVVLSVPRCDVLYVNAGLAAPPAAWLRALRPGGRMVFPWRPSERIGLAMLVTRRANGFSADPFMPSWFIPCASPSLIVVAAKAPTAKGARETRSLRLTQEAPPDASATAVIGDIWFSSRPVPGG
jgi:protein-L-isoaspartate(D-aspartate) O-methyltransferase